MMNNILNICASLCLLAIFVCALIYIYYLFVHKDK